MKNIPAFRSPVHMALSCASLTVMMLAATAPSRPAFADLIVQANTSGFDTGIFTATPSSTGVYGEGTDLLESSFGGAHSGLANPGFCERLGPPAVPCAFMGPQIAAVAGEIDATQGHFRAIAFSDPDAGGTTLGLALRDVVTLGSGPTTFKVHLDADLSGDNLWFFKFTVALDLGLDDPLSPLLSAPLYTAQFDSDGGPQDVALDASFVLQDQPFCAISIFAGCTAGTNIPILVQLLWTGSDGDRLVADHSAYLGIDGITASANGYSYPGFQAAAAAVPVPPSVALFLFGIVGLGATRHRAR